MSFIYAAIANFIDLIIFNKFLQFIRLPYNYDPDSYINEFTLKKFIDILKKPLPIINFIFEQS